jgi:hypothetical protein
LALLLLLLLLLPLLILLLFLLLLLLLQRRVFVSFACSRGSSALGAGAILGQAMLGCVGGAPTVATTVGRRVAGITGVRSLDTVVPANTKHPNLEVSLQYS